MKKRIKDNMVFIIATVLLITLAGVGIYQYLTKEKSKEEPKTEQTEPSKKKGTVSPVEEETVDEKNHRTAKLKLEHPYSQADEVQTQAVVVAFDEAVADFQKAKTLAVVIGTIENRLSLTDIAMIQTFAMAILVNQYTYQKAKLEVSPSESDDVVQFLVVLTKENEENCYFIGNFNTTVNQIQLKAYIGGNIGATFG